MCMIAWAAHARVCAWSEDKPVESVPSFTLSRVLGIKLKFARHAKKVPLGQSHPTSPINRSLTESSGSHHLNLLINSVLVTVGHPDLTWLLIRYNMKQIESREMFLPKKFSLAFPNLQS